MSRDSSYDKNLRRVQFSPHESRRTQEPGWSSDSLVQQVIQEVSSFHQVFYAAMVMAGPGPLRAALAEKPAPAQLRADIENFAAALAATDDDQADPYDDMHAALELALTEEPDLNERIRYLLAVTGLAARLTDTDVNPRRAMKGDVSTPGMLTHYLLVEPAMHAALVLHRDDDDAAVRARMLSLAAQVAPVAAGDLASYTDAGHLASAAGLVPVPRDSGRRTGNLHRPKRYSRRLRRVFYLSAQTSIIRDGPNRDFYLKKRAEGCKHVQAVIALARRRVSVLWALLRDDRVFTPAPPIAVAA